MIRYQLLKQERESMLAAHTRAKLEWIRNGYASACQSEQTAAVQSLLSHYQELLGAVQGYITAEKGTEARAEAFAKLKMMVGR